MKLNLVGQKYGRLTVIEDAGKYKEHHTMWKCQCQCGTIKNVPTTSLRAGRTKSCGCVLKENRKPMIGLIFGRLTVLDELGKNNRKQLQYKCQCSCENKTIKTIVGNSLRNGSIRSCGCLTKENHHKLPKGEAARNLKFYHYQNGAKDRNLSFDITLDDFVNLTQSNCYYCGSVPLNISGKNNKYNGVYIYNGIDRLDNEIGYTLENCVPACEICNKAKNNRTQKEFQTWITRLVDFQLSKKKILGFPIKFGDLGVFQVTENIDEK